MKLDNKYGRQDQLPIGRFFFSCLTDNRRPSAPPEAVPALRHIPFVGEVLDSMMGAGQMIAVTVNQISLGRRAGAFRSSKKKKSLVWSLDRWKGDRSVRTK